MDTARIIVLALAGLIWGGCFGTLESSAAWAQVDTAPNEQPAAQFEPPTANDLLVRAYEQAQRASGAHDYTSILSLCQTARQAGLAPEAARYCKQLTAWAANRRGEALIEQGHDEQALADFDTAVRNAPQRWKPLYNRALAHARRGQFKQAMADLDRVIDLEPNSAIAYFNRGEVHYETGQYEKAVENYTQAIEIAGSDSTCHNSRGHAYFRLGKYRLAVHDFTSAIKLDPQNAHAYTNRGDLYSELGYYERAVHDYKKAIAIAPEQPRAYQSVAWLMATCPEKRFRNAQAAFKILAKATTEQSEHDPLHLKILAAAQASAGDFELAQKTVRRALQLLPRNEVSPYERQLALYRQRQPYRLTPQPLAPQIAAQPNRAVEQATFDSPQRPTR